LQLVPITSNLCVNRQNDKSNLVSIVVSEHQNVSWASILLVRNFSNAYIQSRVILIHTCSFTSYAIMLQCYSTSRLWLWLIYWS